MSQVEWFCQTNPDLPDEFKEFARQYSSLADVWENCSCPTWLLAMLDRLKYPDAGKIEKYIDWLRDRVHSFGNDNLAERKLQGHEAKSRSSVERIEADLTQGRITSGEAEYYRCRGLLRMAFDVGNDILKQKAVRAKLDSIYMKAEAKANGESDALESNEHQVSAPEKSAQAQKLKEFVGNPF